MRSRKAKPVESHTFAGMETAVEKQAAAAGELQAEELTARMREPLGNINHRAASMEEDSPLFFGKVNPTLFDAEPQPITTNARGLPVYVDAITDGDGITRRLSRPIRLL